MHPNEQWLFEIVVRLSDSGPPSYIAYLLPSSNNPLAEKAKGIIGRGQTPALAIANLFHLAYWQVEQGVD